MASKRHMRRKSCERKVRHKTVHGALVAIRRTDDKPKHGNSNLMRPYACKFCGGWHNGH